VGCTHSDPTRSCRVADHKTTPVATALPAVASLAIVAAAACAVVGYEALHYADARARIRHG
jgi:hypothetical protein